jgi:hypothetical protein
MNTGLTLVLIIGAVLVLGCAPESPPGYREQHVPISAETLKPYPALFSVDRLKMGFPELPTGGTVRILTVDRLNWKLEYPPPNLDVSFQFFTGTSFYPHTEQGVALKRTDGDYKWVSESMTFSGPNRYISDDQLINESITITCEIEQVVYIGTNVEGTVIRYFGPDKRLARSGNYAEGLSVAQVGPILREWGYKYDVDTAQAASANGASRRP